MKCFGVIIQIKPLQQYFLMVLSIEYVVLTFESEGVILWSDHSNETSSAVLSHGTIYLECNSNFLVGAWNPRMWPFKWNFLSSTFTWFHLFFSMLLNNFRKFSWLFTWATFGSESFLLFWSTEQTVRGVTTVRAGSTDLWRDAGHKPSTCGWDSRQSC